MKLKFLCAVMALTSAWAVPAAAQAVAVSGAWVRATVPGQRASGAFMTLQAREGTRLVGIATPVAGGAEVHEMKMDGDIMRMRAVAALDLPPGRRVEFKPGGYHVMLMDLKAPLLKGSTVALTLEFQDATGAKHQMEIKVPVAVVAPGAKTDGKAAMETPRH